MASKAGQNEPPRPIIVKKVTVVQAAGHHGGAWKVAYADFVTAMMAFFLLLWLLGATTEQQRKGLADYFTPTLVKTSEDGGGAGGLLGGSSLTDVDKYPHRAGQTGTKSLTIPRDATGGPKEGAEAVKRMRARLEQKLQGDQKLQKLLRQVKMVQTSEGIRIDLVDDADFSMFTLGTTVLTGEAQSLIRALAESVMPEGGALTIRGHTDALPWRSGMRGNNWALSAGRAEATRQALMLSGIGENRFKRIEGVADRELLVKDNPGDPRNRRISILMGR
jgi:chemotaxis protein MotB